MAKWRRRHAIGTDDARLEPLAEAGKGPVCGATREGEGEFYGGIAGARRAYRDLKKAGRDDEARTLVEFMTELKKLGLTGGGGSGSEV